MFPKHYLASIALGTLAYAGTLTAAVGTVPTTANSGSTLMSAFVQSVQARLVDAPDIRPSLGLQTVVATGTFTGASDHETRGTVRLLKSDDGYEIRLSDDFYLDGAPTPVLGFGDGDYVHASQFADLQRKRGAQAYKLPADFTPAQFSQIYVWCERFDIPLGVADLKTPA